MLPARIILVVICLCSLFTSQARAQDAKVLLWRLKALGIEAETASKIQQVLRSELERVPAFSIVPDVKDDMGCTGGTGCLKELGEAAGATFVVSGVLGTLGDVFSLDVKLIDVRSGTEVRRVAQTWSGEEKLSIEVMRQVATRLLRPEAYKGRLTLKTNVDGVKIYIDGDFIRRTPLESPLELTPGRHALKLVCAGFKDFEQFVDVPFDRTVPVSVELVGSGVSGVVAAERAEDLFAIGIKGGLVTNLGPFLGPKLGLEFGLRLPFWEGRLSVMLGTGAYGSVETRRVDSPALGNLSVDSEILVWPMELNLQFRLLPDYPFSPYLAAGPGYFLVWQTLESDGLDPQSFRDGLLGFQGAAGLELRLGPGVILLEARYQYVDLDAPEAEGGVGGQVGGLEVLAGYRLLL
jgi:hypothetical protein